MGQFFRNFFLFEGWDWKVEGYFSWQHLTFVTFLMIVMTSCAIWLGLKNRHADAKTKNKVMIWAAILIDGFELIKIVLGCIREKDALNFLTNLPLFLCSIQLITIPIAAFTKGKLKEASLDFVSIFGLLGAVLGTYLAGQNYSCYPVLSFTNVVSGITHSISGFCALYILISGMASMKFKNIWITFTILGCFGACAYAVNRIFLASTGSCPNYMFLMGGDGTPYDIVYNLVNGNKVIYPLLVIFLFVIWISVFYGTLYLIRKNKVKKQEKDLTPELV